MVTNRSLSRRRCLLFALMLVCAPLGPLAAQVESPSGTINEQDFYIAIHSSLPNHRLDVNWVKPLVNRQFNDKVRQNLKVDLPLLHLQLHAISEPNAEESLLLVVNASWKFPSDTPADQKAKLESDLPGEVTRVLRQSLQDNLKYRYERRLMAREILEHDLKQTRDAYEQMQLEMRTLASAPDQEVSFLREMFQSTSRQLSEATLDASLAELRDLLVRDESKSLAQEIATQTARATQFSTQLSELEQRYQAVEGPARQELEKEWEVLAKSDPQLHGKIRENQEKLSQLSDQMADIGREKIMTERRVQFLRERLAELQKAYEQASTRQRELQQGERRANDLVRRIDILQAERDQMESELLLMEHAVDVHLWQ